MSFILAGVDEAGRGPLAGPVVAAAVILAPNFPKGELRDSKKLTAKRRELLFDLIHEKSLAISIGHADPVEIDRLNILQASLLAMKRAVEGLKLLPQLVQVDGKFIPEIAIPCEAIIKGDDKVPEISAASIIAKVTRDREMAAIHALYPEYGFAQHSGYPTKAHCEALIKYGITPLHRKSFGPVKKLLECL